MPAGGCLCGSLRYEYTGEPDAKVLCHCEDCQKISGSIFSTNALIPNENFKIVSGTPSKYSKKADSGNEITSFFCATCGSTPWRESVDTFGAKKIVKAGTLDEKTDLDKLAPGLELFTQSRSKWLPSMPGAQGKETQ